MFRATVVISVSVLLTGCITPRLAHSNLPGIYQDKALVFFSTGTEYKSLSFHTALSLIEAETREERQLGHFINAPQLRSHFQDEYGHVQSLFLEEGTYYLAPRAGNLYRCLSSRPLYKFSVKRGEFVYLGSFLLTFDDRLLHSPTVNRQRDSEYLLQRNPALSDFPISVPPVEVSYDERGEC
jgi:hypothetical protein